MTRNHSARVSLSKKVRWGWDILYSDPLERIRSNLNSTRWPHIGQEELLTLWQRHAPGFIRIDDVERDLPRVRDTFLSWLAYKGVDLGGDPTERLGKRIRIERVSLTNQGDQALTEVVLSLKGEMAEGHRKGSPLHDEIIRQSAEATLDAINALIPVVAFGLEQAFTAGGNGQEIAQIAVVVVRDPESGPSQRYVGACPITASVPEAATKATMAAINRRTEIAAAMLGI